MTDQREPMDSPPPTRWHHSEMDVGDWLRSGQAEVVKHGPHRTVYRVRLPGFFVYWKRCRLAGPRSWLRQLIRPPKARLEFDKARELRRRGIATVEPIAWAGGRWPAESHLVTRELSDAEPLDKFLETKLDSPELRRTVTVALGRYLAQLHNAGVTHPDPHPGNVLVRIDGGVPRFYLLDLHAIRLSGPLSWSAARANLVLFNRWFLMRATRTDRLRFWMSYYSHRDGMPARFGTERRPSLRERGSGPTFAPRTATISPRPTSTVPFEASRDLEERTWASNRRFWKSRDRRCLGTNRYFRKLRSRVAVGHAARDLDAGVLRQLLDDPDAPFRTPGVKLLKDSRSSTVAEWTIPTPDGPKAVIYKRFRVTSRWEPLRNLLRRSPTLHSWVMGHGLIHRGLPTARPLLVLHRYRFGLRREGYLLTEKVADARELGGVVGDLSPAEKLDLSAKVARLVRGMHQRRLSHRDLKAANVVVTQKNETSCRVGRVRETHPTCHSSPVLIDLVGVRLGRRMTVRRRVKDLARLAASFHDSPHVSRSDKLRFLRTYLNGKSADWKSWWASIAEAVSAKVARNRKRGRPLA